MKSHYLYCDHLIDMKGGKASLQTDICIEIKGSRIQSLSHWNKKETKNLPFLKKEEAKKPGFSLNATSKSHHLYLKDHLVLPGFINTHTHLPMSLFRGLKDHLPFHQWLFDCILPLEAKMLNPDFVRVGAELSALECIENGITTVYDMYSFAKQTGEVFEGYGLRGFFGEDINDRRKDWLSLMDELCERFSGEERILPALAPHAPYTCEDDLLKKVLHYSEKKDLPILIHVSETKKEVEESLKKHSLSPVERLHRLGITKRPSLFVHMVHLSAKDIKRLQETETAISYNPESNMHLGSGIAPIKALLQEGVTVGLGTDGAGSNNDLNLLAEMNTGAKLQKLHWKEEDTLITAEDMFKMITWGGAKALKRENEIGSIEKGKFADLVAIDLNRASFRPQGDESENILLSHLVYAGSNAKIHFVLCHGKLLKWKDHILPGKNLPSLFKKVERLRKNMESLS